MSAGLDYPGVGPEHGYLKETGRATYQAGDGCSGYRGLPASLPDGRDHPSAGALTCHRLRRGTGQSLPAEAVLLVNLSGRGDKDIFTVAEALGVQV